MHFEREREREKLFYCIVGQFCKACDFKRGTNFVMYILKFIFLIFLLEYRWGFVWTPLKKRIV